MRRLLALPPFIADTEAAVDLDKNKHYRNIFACYL
jgi:hypothetical protein